MRGKAEHLNIKKVRQEKSADAFRRQRNLLKGSQTSHHPLVSQLVGHNWLRGVLAEYWLLKLAHLSRGSLKTELKSFKLLWKFLDYEKSKNSRVYRKASDLDPRFVSRLVSWMSGNLPSKRLADNTKAANYNHIRRFFEWLKFEKRILSESWPVRQNPWPLYNKKIASTEALPDFQLGKILLAAAREIRETLDKWDATASILSNPLIAVLPMNSRCRDYKSRDVALKALLEAYPTQIPIREEIHKTRPGLERAITSYTHLTMKDFIESRFPTARSLVPFVVTIGMMSFLNPVTLLQLKWSEIEDNHPIFGADRWRLAAEKGRSKKLQRRSFPAKVNKISNPVFLLRRLKEQTAQLRVGVEHQHSDHVFLFHSIHAKPRYGVFVTEGGNSSWQHGLKAFISDNNLEDFSLVNLRVTGSDLVDELTEGDVKAQQVMLNHASTSTTERHYTSLASRQRREEKLTAAIGWRERFARSGGKSDTRGRLGSTDAATPGYACFDPYDSPIEGQVSGRLCSAYGRCPACPLKGLNTKSPQMLAYLIQLRMKLRNARLQVAYERWGAIWKPTLLAVEDDIKLFSKSAIKAARKLTPPILPEIE